VGLPSPLAPLPSDGRGGERPGRLGEGDLSREGCLEHMQSAELEGGVVEFKVASKSEESSEAVPVGRGFRRANPAG